MDRAAVDVVRRFNRAVTQQVGVLRSGYLGRDRSLGASRVLWEIGAQGREVRELRAALDLDSGYLSRLLRSLERSGLAVTESDGADARVRTVRLTPEGAEERRLLDERSDALAWSLVEPLTEKDRARFSMR
jgi:DNA-binding MarR family transcriptional regulator